MKVTVIGGGHIGTTLACYIKHYDPSLEINLHVRRPERFEALCVCHDIERSVSYSVHLDRISSDFEKTVRGADLIFIALPHFLVEGTFASISRWTEKGACICVLPGCGGCEFFARKYFGEDITLLGFQRVPFTAKLVEYGRETNLKSWKPYSVVGAQKGGDLEEGCKRIEACGLQTRKAENYLSITLAPSNPILHTARLYDLFGAYDRDHRFPERIKFYAGWTDSASESMLSMDTELHELLQAIPEVKSDAIRPLTEHYESRTVEEMTRKMNSIPSFRTVYAPLVPVGDASGEYVVDTGSRLFLEDFPWGLAIIRAFCQIVGTSAPTMDRLLQWYADYMGLAWYDDGRFCGKDLIYTGVPQNYGIQTREQLISLYI